MNYDSVEMGRRSAGLRLVLSRGVLGPWGIAARNILDYKGIAYTAVGQDPGGSNDALAQWTGSHSAPVAMYDEERPRAHWYEILLLAERLSPDPSLIPGSQEERTQMFGLCHEICGEDGLGWSARRLLLAIRQRDSGRTSRKMQHRYGDAWASPGHSVKRLASILKMLSDRLVAQALRRSAYLVGERLSAADIYWAAFSNMVVGFPPQWTAPATGIPMACRLREECGVHVPRNLIEHRARVMREAFTLPIVV